MLEPAFSGKLICESVASFLAADSQIIDPLIDIKVLDLPDYASGIWSQFVTGSF
jgi:hypothetical protein